MIRNVQWQGFIRKAKLDNAPDSFQDDPSPGSQYQWGGYQCADNGSTE